MIKIIKIKKKLKINIKFFKIKCKKSVFFILNNFKIIYIILLATLLAYINFLRYKKLKKNIFLNFKTPNGRGDISKIKFKKKKIFLVDESYNSNPLSLKSAIENYDKIKVKKFKKIFNIR
jgi:murE/murF fusion protein